MVNVCKILKDLVFFQIDATFRIETGSQDFFWPDVLSSDVSGSAALRMFDYSKRGFGGAEVPLWCTFTTDTR